jgi:hypothetical protein
MKTILLLLCLGLAWATQAQNKTTSYQELPPQGDWADWENKTVWIQALSTAEAEHLFDPITMTQFSLLPAQLQAEGRPILLNFPTACTDGPQKDKPFKAYGQLIKTAKLKEQDPPYTLKVEWFE